MEYRKHRMFGYSLAIILHCINIVYLVLVVLPKVYENPKLVKLKNLQARYFTVWTVVIQLLYCVVSLLYELKLENITKRKNVGYRRYVNGFRDVLFSSILWPSCWVVAIIFWSLNLYDKDLLFPKHTSELAHPLSHQIMHTMIVPVAVWEVVYRRRSMPVSHRKYVYPLIFYFIFFFIVVAYTYIERDFWLYPIIGKFYGTIFFPLIPLTTAGIVILSYVIQWPLAKTIWRQNVKKTV